jgi:hypothetical protein
MLTILLPVAAATLGAGCATFTNDNVAARVNDLEYSHDQLDGIMAAIGVPDESRTDLEAIRSVASTLILAGSLDDFFVDEGIDVTDADIDAVTQDLDANLATFASAPEDVQDLLIRAQVNLTIARQLPNGAEVPFLALEDADIYVDPQIGTYDAATGAIIALG